MAHIDPSTFRTEPADRALLCVGARTWHALAITALALMVVAPALVVGALVLLEAALSDPNRAMARARLQAEPASLRANAPRLLQFSTACTPIEPAPCATD